MKMNEMFPSNYLKKEDVSHPITATIRDVITEEVSGDHGKESKPVIRFNGSVKPMILNKGNGELLCSLYGDDSLAWHGKSIELYMDPNVMFGGKRVGGIRLRAPSQNGAGAAPASSSGGAGYAISNGKTVTKKNNADEVRTYLMELLDMGVLLTEWRIKGPDGAVVNGPDWMLANSGAPAEDPIPF